MDWSKIPSPRLLCVCSTVNRKFFAITHSQKTRIISILLFQRKLNLAYGSIYYLCSCFKPPQKQPLSCYCFSFCRTKLITCLLNLPFCLARLPVFPYIHFLFNGPTGFDSQVEYGVLLWSVEPSVLPEAILRTGQQPAAQVQFAF